MSIRSTCQHCKKKRYSERMVMINSKSPKNGKPEWACRGCVSPDQLTLLSVEPAAQAGPTVLPGKPPISVHFQGNRHYLYFIPGDQIVRREIAWGDGVLSPGDKMASLGNGKARTTLNIGQELTYEGLFLSKGLAYALFSCIDGDKPYHIAPIYMDKKEMLMPSGPNTFWDIKAFDSLQTKRQKAKDNELSAQPQPEEAMNSGTCLLCDKAAPLTDECCDPCIEKILSRDGYAEERSYREILAHKLEINEMQANWYSDSKRGMINQDKGQRIRFLHSLAVKGKILQRELKNQQS